MKFLVKDMDIATGGPKVALINSEDAKIFDIHHMDRVNVLRNNKKITAIVNIAESAKILPEGKIGLFEEAKKALNAKSNDEVKIQLTLKPKSVNSIKRKLEGKELSYDEFLDLVRDIVDDNLSTIELTSYVAANYTLGMSRQETLYLTKAMIETGEVLKHKQKIIADLHSIGGVPGNRTTLIAAPIAVAGGLILPKTSSRAITSPAGTADTMEVFCPVSASIQKAKGILKKAGGFILWGGSFNLAPADEKIIKIESPLTIDPEGQMLASILSKKKSVGATHLLTEIPVGRDTKVKNLKQANHLKEEFEYLCGQLGIKLYTWITEAKEPIGNGIGPVLEAIDCLKVLKNHKDASDDLRKKSIEMAGLLFDLTGRTKNGKGIRLAEELLVSGKAYDAMIKIIKAQGGREPELSKLMPGEYKSRILSAKNGVITGIDNLAIARIARIAGAPEDKKAGIYVNKHISNHVKRGEKLFTIHANNQTKLDYALQAARQLETYFIE